MAALPAPLIAIIAAPDGAMSPVEIADAARGTAELVFLVDRPDATGSPAFYRICQSLAPTSMVDFADPDSCVAALAATRAVAVATFADAHCALVDEVNRLAYGGPPVPPRWAKDAQRDRLVRAGVSGVRQAPLAGRPDAASTPAGRDGVRAGIELLGWPVVVKPVRGVASRDVWLLRSAAEVPALLDDLAARGLRPDGFVVETYIEGSPPASAPHLADYVSVELFVGPGRTFAMVTDRPPLASPCRETGIVGPTAVEPDVEAELIRGAHAAHRALGLSVGAYHVEMKLTAGRPEVIEVNGRLGGYVRRLVRYGTDVDLGRLALGCLAGIDPVAAPRWRRHVLGLLFQAPRGAVRVGAGPGRREIAGLPGVIAVDHVSPVGTALDWRVGSGGAVVKLWVEADSGPLLRDRTLATVAHLMETFRFVDEHGQPLRDDAWWSRLTGGGGAAELLEELRRSPVPHRGEAAPQNP